MAMKKFGADAKKNTDVKPIEFDFYGTVIKARRTIPVDKFFNYVAKVSEDTEDGAARVAAVNEYLDASFTPNERKKFSAVLADESYDIGIEELMEVINFLIEERAENPTKPS